MPEVTSSKNVTVQINGEVRRVSAGSTVAVLLLQSDAPCRISVSGESRTALCGMGICFECRAVIDGIPHRRACQVLCHDGMTVETQK